MVKTAVQGRTAVETGEGRQGLGGGGGAGLSPWPPDPQLPGDTPRLRPAPFAGGGNRLFRRRGGRCSPAGILAVMARRRTA